MLKLQWASVLFLLGCTTQMPAEPGSGGQGGVSEGGAQTEGGAGGAGGAVAGGAGGAGGVPTAVCSRFASEVISSRFGPGQDHGRDAMPGVVLGPPEGGGELAGSVDVVSLGNGGEIVLGFGEGVIEDGPGADFVIFENAFVAQSTMELFAELATVEVSHDGQQWTAFACDATEPPYGSCAGHSPVHLSGDDGPFDPTVAGGDPFDLSDVGVAAARFVRITDREDLLGIDGVFDLDAVGIVHLRCP